MSDKFISIPSTVAIDFFKEQIMFFHHQHCKIYSTDAKNKAIIPIIKYNTYNEKNKAKTDVDWGLTLPYKMVESVYDLIPIDNKFNPHIYLPINLFTSARQVMDTLEDDTIIEIIDADLVHLKPYPKNYHDLKDNEIIADNFYEDWHMHISTPTSENRHIIQEFLTHNEDGYMNGGFNIIGKVKTIKSIMDDIIYYSIKVTEKMHSDPHSWWCAMYGLNIACHNNKIKMINGDNCYYPCINKIEDKHYIAHYSCDKTHYDKRFLPNVNVDLFPDDLFYNSAKEYINSIKKF